MNNADIAIAVKRSMPIGELIARVLRTTVILWHWNTAVHSLYMKKMALPTPFLIYYFPDQPASPFCAGMAWTPAHAPRPAHGIESPVWSVVTLAGTRGQARWRGVRFDWCRWPVCTLPEQHMREERRERRARGKGGERRSKEACCSVYRTQGAREGATQGTRCGEPHESVAPLAGTRVSGQCSSYAPQSCARWRHGSGRRHWPQCP